MSTNVSWPDKVIYRFTEWRDATFVGVVLVGAFVLLGIVLVYVALVRILG